MARPWIWLSVAALLATPAVAKKKPVEKMDAEQAGRMVGTLAFMLGFGDTFETDGESDGSKNQESSAAPTLAIIPGIDKKLGNVVAFGGECMFVWTKGEDGDADRRLLLSPHLRLRMSFPVYNQVTFDGLLGVGPAIWTGDDTLSDAQGGATRFGWSLRFAFGLAYAINDAVAAFADLGYYQTTSYGDDLTWSLNTIPISAGLRSSF